MGRALISVAAMLVVVLGPLLWLLMRSTNKDQRFKDRSAMMRDENYLALEQAANLLARILEQDEQLPALLIKHREEAVEIVDSFHQRQLRKGK